MGFLLIEYRTVRTVVAKNFEDLTVPARIVLDQGIQLAVGKSPGTALAEGDIAVRVKLPTRPKGIDRLFPLSRGQSALQNNGAVPRFREHEPRKESRGTAAYDDRTRTKRVLPSFRELVRSARIRTYIREL